MSLPLSQILDKLGKFCSYIVNKPLEKRNIHFFLFFIKVIKINTQLINIFMYEEQESIVSYNNNKSEKSPVLLHSFNDLKRLNTQICYNHTDKADT